MSKLSPTGDHGIGTTGRVVKIWLPVSSSTATPVNILSPDARHLTDPTKSLVSVRVNSSSIKLATCPFRAREMSTDSNASPPHISQQRTVARSASRFRIAAANSAWISVVDDVVSVGDGPTIWVFSS